MSEKPILFSGEMVRAIQAGRKTQTRRDAKFSDVYRLTDERITAIHSNDETIIATKTDTGISERRLPGGERRQDLLPDALRWIWSQGARGLVCVKWPQQREGIPHCFLVPQQQESNKGSASAGLYGVSWYATNLDSPNQALEREQTGQQADKSNMGDTRGKLERPPRAWHCNHWGEALGLKIVRRSTGTYSLRRNNGAMFPPPRRTSFGDVTICHFRNLPWLPKMTIWVKETHLPKASGTIYRADFDPIEAAGIGGMYGGWKPSIFMPRKYSRITLEITAVRAERVQSITDSDAQSEGCCGVSSTQFGVPNFRYVWESINGHESWKANPWVWVVTFKVVGPTNDKHYGRKN